LKYDFMPRASFSRFLDSTGGWHRSDVVPNKILRDVVGEFIGTWRLKARLTLDDLNGEQNCFCLVLGEGGVKVEPRRIRRREFHGKYEV